MGNQDVVRDRTPRDEGRLMHQDYGIKELLKPKS